MAANLPEVWLRGPVEGIAPLLQPVAHALLQAVEEVQKITQSFPDDLLWKRPAGVASVAFHLQHLTGVLDRLTSYAGGQQLSSTQMEYLQSEGRETMISIKELVHRFEQKVEEVLERLRSIHEEQLAKPRSVGRRALPSTVLGLLFHAAEHTMRHVGQLLVTVKVLHAAGGESRID